jgi:hypothetical protein
VAKLLSEFGMLANPETRAVVSVSVMRIWRWPCTCRSPRSCWPAGGRSTLVFFVAIAIAAVAAALCVAIRFGPRLSQFVANQSVAVILLTVLGTIC